MEPNVLAAKMLEWKEKKDELDALEEEIKGAVLEIGATQTVGNVRASYSSGRNVYEDWESAGQANASPEDILRFTTHRDVIDVDAVLDACPPDLIAKHTSVVDDVDWKALCEDVKIERLIDRPGTPSVTMKII